MSLVDAHNPSRIDRSRLARVAIVSSSIGALLALSACVIGPKQDDPIFDDLETAGPTFDAGFDSGKEGGRAHEDDGVIDPHVDAGPVTVGDADGDAAAEVGDALGDGGDAPDSSADADGCEHDAADAACDSGGADAIAED